METLTIAKNRLQGTRITKIRQPKLLTYEDYARLTPTETGNYELHNGKIIYMPSPSSKHQRISTLLHILFGGFVLKNKLGEVFAAPIDTKFTEIDTLQPDLIFISTLRKGIIEENKINGAPDLVVEILSPSNDAREMSYKKYIYESSGVQEYWLINLQNQTLAQYESIDGELRWKQTLQKTDTLNALVVSSFSLNLEEIFE